MERNVDLHIHTTCSDGVLTPKQVIDNAVENNISVVSIADHDSIMAYTEELFAYAEARGVTLIPAVEMSTRYNGVGVHVLGYNFDLENAIMRDTLSRLSNARVDYLHNVTAKLEELGYKVRIEELQELPTVTKAHISLDIISNEDNRRLLLSTFGHIPSKGEFIESIMNEGCPAYVEKFSISPVDASKIIRSAGGKVVLAHPVCYKYEDNLESSQVIDMAKTMEVDGIESNYLYVDRNDNLIDEIEYWNNIANENNWITTIGSDYHSSDGLRPEIGWVNYGEKLENIDINRIITNLIRK